MLDDAPLNVFFTLLPTLLNAVTPATAISAAIRPYSMAVAPRVSRIMDKIIDMMWFLRLCGKDAAWIGLPSDTVPQVNNWLTARLAGTAACSKRIRFPAMTAMLAPGPPLRVLPAAWQ